MRTRGEHPIRRSLKAVARLALAFVLMAALHGVTLAHQRKAPPRRVVAKTVPAKAPAARAALTAAVIHDAEQTLADLGYWTGPVDGKLDPATRHALIAFQKVEGRDTTGRLTIDEVEAIRNAEPPAPREKNFPYIEIDLSRQVLIVFDESGRATRILPVSTGNGKEFTSEGWTRRAITPTGRFKVHRKIEGWRKSPLGMIYYPVYFLHGIAIHGYASVPTRPASHGCVRIPMYAAKEFSKMTEVGTWVVVHNGSPLLPPRRNTP